MKAMVLEQTGPLDDDSAPLRMVDLPVPRPAPHELLVRVTACGVCHTELDEIEGRLIPPRLPLVLGHEIVGTVAETGSDVTAYAIGDRVGVGWIHSSCGGPDENLSDAFRATGYHVNGGYAEYMTAPRDFVYPLPAALTDEAVAPPAFDPRDLLKKRRCVYVFVYIYVWMYVCI